MADEEIELILKNYFTVPVGAKYHEDVLEKLRTFEVRDSDMFLIGHAKTGTTWAQEMIWLIANDLDFAAAETFIDQRFPVLELFSFFAAVEQKDIPVYHADSLGYIKRQKDPRFIKTHLRGSYLPEQIQNGAKKPKIVYIARNAKDTCLSLYHFWTNLLKIYTGTLDDFCKVFLAGRVGSGLYWEHILYFWNRRNQANILFIKYEDMKGDLAKVIRQTAEFLGKAISEGHVSALLNWLDVDAMRNNSAVNHNDLYKQSGFIRAGKAGGFKEEMSLEMSRKFDEWTQKFLKDSGLKM